MKLAATIAKILAAVAAVAGAVYLIATYGDKIVAWAKSLLNCPCCCADDEACCCADDEVCCCEEAPAEAPEAQEAAAEVPAEAAPAEDTCTEADFEA